MIKMDDNADFFQHHQQLKYIDIYIGVDGRWMV